MDEIFDKGGIIHPFTEITRGVRYPGSPAQDSTAGQRGLHQAGMTGLYILCVQHTGPVLQKSAERV